MNKFVMAEQFQDIGEYNSYPYSHLYYRGTLVNKAFADSWQYRMLYNAIQSGRLYKAKLNKGFHLYKFKISIKTSAGTVDFIEEVIAKNKAEAKSKAMGNLFAKLHKPEIETEAILC